MQQQASAQQCYWQTSAVGTLGRKKGAEERERFTSPAPPAAIGPRDVLAFGVYRIFVDEDGEQK